MKKRKLLIEVESRLSQRDIRIFVHDAVEQRFNDRAYTGHEREHVLSCKVVTVSSIKYLGGFIGYRNAKPKTK